MYLGVDTIKYKYITKWGILTHNVNEISIINRKTIDVVSDVYREWDTAPYVAPIEWIIESIQSILEYRDQQIRIKESSDKVKIIVEQKKSTPTIKKRNEGTQLTFDF